MSLRDHYALGRLTLDELDERVELALRARSRAALRRSLTELPDSRGRAIVRATVRGAVLLLLTWTWFAFSFALLVVFGLTLLIHGATAVEVVAVPPGLAGPDVSSRAVVATIAPALDVEPVAELRPGPTLLSGSMNQRLRRRS